MVPNSEQRDAIFKKFGRAFFKQDLDLMYEVVTPDFNWTVDDGDKVHVLDSREKIGNFFEQRRGKFENVRFDDVVFQTQPSWMAIACCWCRSRACVWLNHRVVRMCMGCSRMGHALGLDRCSTQHLRTAYLACPVFGPRPTIPTRWC